jgi:hypothetical protein
MSDLHRFALRPDYRAQLVGLFPWVTAAQILRFDDLVRSDRIISDDGETHKDLEDWVAAVMRRGGEAAPQGPTPAWQVVAEVRA